MPKVLGEYGIKYDSILPFQSGYRNEIWPIKTTDGQIINVTFHKSETNALNRILRTNKISESLAELGMPTRYRLDERVLALKSKNITVYVGIYNYLPGLTIPWEAYTMKRIKALGKTMSKMHGLLAKTNYQQLPSVYDEYLQINKKMREYFSRSDVISAIKQKLGLRINIDNLAKYGKLLEILDSRTGKQPLHMDFVRGNILFEGDKITGILDFEKVARGHVVMDVSRTLAFLLVDCKYKTPDKVRKYFLKSGYLKNVDGPVVDMKVMDLMVEMFLVYDFYKFLRHNPYESLSQNQHYLRTRDILINLGVLSFT